MKSIQTILRALNIESPDEMSLTESYTIEVDGFMDLTIEKIYEEKIAVTHYYTQRGDLMRDPEVVFDISGGEWIPVEYRQDPGIRQQDMDGLDLGGFLETWNKNLRNQGYVDAATRMC